MALTRPSAALGQFKGRSAAALVAGGRLADVLVDPPDDVPRTETLLRGVADRPAPGLGGQFLKLPDGQSAFLRGGQLDDGQAALVQVRAYAESGKAVPVTTVLRLKGRFAVATWDDQPVNFAKSLSNDRRRELSDAVQARFADLRGVILRSDAEAAETAHVLDEIAGLLEARAAAQASTAQGRVLDGPTAQQIAARDWPVQADHSFEDLDLYGALDGLLRPEEPLKHGQAFIEPCRAFVAIDVNTAAHIKQNAGLHANIDLSKDLPRILRCRGLGGQIVIDFAPMAKRLRPQIEQALTAALREDAIKTDLVGWTSLGHFEMRRAWTRYPVHWIK